MLTVLKLVNPISPSLTPPHDIEAERQLLGALLVRSTLIPGIESQLHSEDIYLESHRLLYKTILEQNREGVLDLDSVQVIQRLSDLSHLEEAGGSHYIMSLAQKVLAPSNAAHHAQRIKNLAMRRKLMEAANNIIKNASMPVEDEDAFLHQVEDSILSITNQSLQSGIQSTKSLQEDFQEHITGLLEARGELRGVLTHYKELDRITSGLKEGTLLVIAARPGEGKTTLALNIAANIALMDQKPVLLYSLEMSQMELMMRLLCSRSQINHEELKRGHVNSRRISDLNKSVDDICRAPIYIDDSGDLTIWECMARTRKFKIDLQQQGKKLGLVIVDYLQLMSDPAARSHGRQHEVATISRCLKQLARIVDAPIIAVSQMNRSVEQRKSRPLLSDLRESGAIEQDADIVMFIHDDTKGEREQDADEFDDGAMSREEKEGSMEMIIAKHRSGPVGDFRLIFRKAINQFADFPELSAKMR